MNPDATGLLARKRALQRALLAWYRANARPLPWRVRPTLYKTVVSELMLQQTRVKTALPCFERWMRELPGFPALAAAPETRVLKLWEGLGYYARARNLRKLARALVAMPAPPRTPGAWRELPGIGPYTAAAIASIACNHPAACVDGNVVRILSRLTADPTRHRDSSAAAKYFAPLAGALLNPRAPGDHNQAMMELGATLCTPAAPRCPACPLRAHCAAARAPGAAPENYPRLAPKQYETQTRARLWLVRATPETKTQTLLLHRSPPAARRLAGIHELPAPEHLALKANSPLLRSAPLIATQTRAITRYRITEKIYAPELTPSLERAINKTRAPLLWFPLEDIELIPLSGPHRRLIRKILGAPLTKPPEF